MTEKPIRIAFGNKKQTGKDTCVTYGMTIAPGELVRFAAPIYQAAEAVLKIAGFPIEKDRDLLRAIGEWARARDQLVWTNAAMRIVDNLPADTNVWCPDLRLRSEVRALKDRGFKIVKIEGVTRDPKTGEELPPTPVADLHRTEVELDDWVDEVYSPNGVWWDYLITNYDSRENLELKVFNLIRDIRASQ